MYIKEVEALINSHTIGAGYMSPGLKLSSGANDLETYYAPFDFINRDAKVVICGITPGKSQALVALDVARRTLEKGGSIEQALTCAKETASFSGAMRKNLCSMLDYIGLPEKLGIACSADMFGVSSSIVHYTSALRYPVFYKGANYSGDSKMTSSTYLWSQTLEMLSEEASVLPNALWIPLGPKVSESLEKLANLGAIDRSRILSGLPHPSGANSERIAYFEGRKERKSLSSKVNPDLIDSAKQRLLDQLSCINRPQFSRAS